ncbi:MAG TPA: hypothetical protein VIK08_03935 [Candidatus Limnocylindrales bacterium]
MNRALPALLLALVAAGCGPTGGAPPTAPRASAALATSNDQCASAKLTIVNQAGSAIGVTLNDQWTATVDANSTRVVEPGATDRPPALTWTAVVTDSKGKSLGSFVVQPMIDFGLTLSSESIVHTTAVLRSQCPRPTQIDYAGLPSNACGGFHLKILNDSSDRVTGAINETWHTTVDAGASQVINEQFSQPQPPVLPWHVAITDANGRSKFEGILGDTPVDQKLTLSDDAAPVQMPYDLSEGC